MNVFRWPVTKAALMALVMVAAACGASASVESATDVTPTAVASADDANRPVFASPTPVVTTTIAPATSGVPQPLAAFGELVSIRSTPLTAVFGPAGGALSLSDGATVTVPAGAFASDVELSVTVADLLFGNYMDDPPDGRIYVLSTVEDLALGQPVVLEVPKQRESVTVSQLVDGVWVKIEGDAVPTTVIEITHFSSNEFSVIGRPRCPADAARAVCSPNQPWGEWYYIHQDRANGDNLVPIDAVPAATLLLPYFDMCLNVCPNLAPPGATPPGAGSNAASNPTPGPTATSTAPPTTAPAPAPTAVRTPGTPVPTTAPTPRPTPRPTPTSSQPACETGYTRHTSGDCRTVGNGCIFPALDFAGRAAGCIFRVECAPVSAGYTVVGNNTCIFTPPGACQAGWTANSSGRCVTPRYGCVHPKLDFTDTGGCVSPSECSPRSEGYSIVGSECIYEPPVSG